MSKRYIFTVVVFILWIAGFYLGTDFLRSDPNFRGVDLVGILSSAPLLGVMLAYACYFAAVGTGIFILYGCLRHVGVKPPLGGLSKAWIFGSFVDNVTPTITPMGEASMAYFMEKFHRIPYTQSLAAIGMYVSAWGLSVSLFSVVAVLLVNQTVGVADEFKLPIVLVIGFFVLITAGWMVLLTNKKLVERIVYRIVRVYNKVYNRLKNKRITFDKCVYSIAFEQSFATLELIMKNKRQIVSSMLLFLIPQVAHVVCIYALLVGYGVQIPFFQVLMVQILSTVAGLISFIPSGLAVYESVSVGLFMNMGVPGAAAIGTIFFYRLIFVWTTNFIGGVVGLKAGVEEVKEVVGALPVHPSAP